MEGTMDQQNGLAEVNGIEFNAIQQPVRIRIALNPYYRQEYSS